MAWFYIVAAGLMEVVWAIALKQSQSFSQLYPSLLFIFSAILSIILLSLALKHLPIGTAYAVWTGIGACGVAIAGIVAFGDTASPARIGFLVMIIAGIAGLNYTT